MPRPCFPFGDIDILYNPKRSQSTLFLRLLPPSTRHMRTAHDRLRCRVASYDSTHSDDYGQHWAPSSSDEGELAASLPPRRALSCGLADHGSRQRKTSQSTSQVQRHRRRTYGEAFLNEQAAGGATISYQPIDAYRKRIGSGYAAASYHDIEQLKRNISAAISTLSLATAQWPLPLPAAAAHDPFRHERFVAIVDHLPDAADLAGAARSHAPASPPSAPRDDCESARHLLERVVLASTDLLSAVVVTEPLAPFRIVHVNRAWTALCGYTGDEVAGKTCAILQGPLTCRDDALRFARAVATSELPASAVVRNYTKSGEPFTNAIVSLPLRLDTTAAIAYHAAVLTRIPD